MDKKERPLPRPKKGPFGGARRGEAGEGQPLMADAIAMAAAAGKLEEFMQREMPDNAYARNLASMMMGMTGMAPTAPAVEAPPAGEETVRGEKEASPQPPEELVRAAGEGDVAAVAEFLKKEHERRGGSPAAEAAPAQRQTDPPAAEQEVMDRLVAIAAENGLTVDWVVLRALKLYTEEYGKTGRL